MEFFCKTSQVSILGKSKVVSENLHGLNAEMHVCSANRAEGKIK